MTGASAGLSAASGSLLDLAVAPIGEVLVSGEVETSGWHDDEVTLDRLQLIHELCADDGVDVVYEDMGPKRRGAWDWKADEIVISPRLTRAQEASTVAHELAHRRLGDKCSTGPRERRAWEFGAAMLILPMEYAAAERRAGHHTAALAIELGVTPKLIEAWRRWYDGRCPEWLRLPIAERDESYGA